MKKLFLAMLVLTLTIFTMVSCSDKDTEDNKKKCDHPEDKIVEVFAKKATCTEDGYTDGKMCSKCGKAVEGMTPIAAFNHKGTTVTTKATAATCEKSGLTEGARCNACLAFIKVAEVIPQLAHQEVAKADVPATCSEAGCTGGTYCKVCENTITDSTIIEPTEEHDLYITKEADADNCPEKSCRVCENVIEKQVAHTYTWTTDTTDPTIQNGVCGCGATSTRPVATTPAE